MKCGLKSAYKKLRYFAQDQNGNVALMMGLAAAPMMMFVGVAVDMGRISSSQVELQIIADKAALAAAATTGTIDERKLVAQKHIASDTDIGGGITITNTVALTADSATVTLKGNVEGTFTAIARVVSGIAPGKGNVPVSAKAVKSTVAGYGICVFSTDEHAGQAIYLYGTGDFNAVGCHLYSNSDATGAITVQGNKTVISAGMHALGTYKKIGGAGSVTGTFAPTATALADPYDIVLDDDVAGTNLSLNSNTSVTLSAKTYNNITIKKGTATFSPGVHFVTGKLHVQAQGKLFGDGVTIVLVGKDAYLDVQSGGVIDIKAPRADQLDASEKQYAGFAIIGYTNEDGEEANNSNIIIGGAGTNIKGIVYTPDQDLKVTGNSGFNVDSKYTPLIAKTIEIGGNGAVGIGLDYNAYGYERPDPLFIDEVTEVRLVL